MNLSLKREHFIQYVSSQLNNIFPDGNTVNLNEYSSEFDLTIDRLDFCYKKVSYQHYFDGSQTYLNHLHSDQYLMFIWFLSNTIYSKTNDISLANKLYYLNKSLHGFDCLFNTALPNIFLIFHGVGTMLGKASYSDYFVALQGCTIGSQKSSYPIMGKGVSLAAGSSIIGNCDIGDRVSVSANSHLFNVNVESNHVSYYDNLKGGNVVKKSKTPYAQNFFNINLNNI